jgi:hypothetical protein
VTARIFGHATATPFDGERPATIGRTFALRRHRRKRDETGERHVRKNADHEIGERAFLHLSNYRSARAEL